MSDPDRIFVAKFEVSVLAGKREVETYPVLAYARFGNWYVHRVLFRSCAPLTKRPPVASDYAWTVTHGPTGHAIRSIACSKALAVDIARALRGVVVELDSFGDPLLNRYIERLRRAWMNSGARGVREVLRAVKVIGWSEVCP